MIYYYLIISFLAISSLFNLKKKSKTVVIIAFIFMSLLSGLRHVSIGNDTLNYFNHFNGVSNYGINYVLASRFEIGYSLLVLFFTKIGVSFNAFLTIISLFINFSVCFFILKYSQKSILSVILFILMRFFFDEMNIFRQFISIALILLFFKNIENKNFKKYCIGVLLASCFHGSALISILLYFLYTKKRFSVKIKSLLITITIIINYFMEPLLIKFTNYFGIYSSYIDKYIDSNKIGNILLFIISMLVLIFISIFLKNKENTFDNKNEVEKFHIFSYNLSFVTMLLSFLSIRLSVLTRIIIYFQIFYIILLPNSLSEIKKAKNYILFSFLIFVLFFLYFTIITYYRPNWNMVNPYKFFWE